MPAPCQTDTCVGCHGSASPAGLSKGLLTLSTEDESTVGLRGECEDQLPQEITSLVHTDWGTQPFTAHPNFRLVPLKAELMSKGAPEAQVEP